MDWPVILARITGAILLALAIYSIYKHFRERARAKAAGVTDKQSASERLLNGVLLYAWYAFSLAFSAGLIVNN